jgi:hypothetical protein
VNIPQKIICGAKEGTKISSDEIRNSKGVKHFNVKIYCVWCLSVRANVPRDICHTLNHY